jgi:hypothetical protein|tara:strand:- start:1697 stop:1945 length:249 start_codon:yes stop_codon:yes gene_type:complete
MENIINEMKRTAKKENDRARKLWGSFGSHGYGRSFVLPPKAEKIQLMLKENKTRKQISKIMNISYQGVSDYIARYNLLGEEK